MAFNIKKKDFNRKVHLVVRDHSTHTPEIITYSNVVTREMVCIALTMTALYSLKAKAANVLNAYVMAPNREKIWTVLCPEFGDNVCKSAFIGRALYGQKSAVAVFRAHPAQCV